MKTIIWLCWLLYQGEINDVDSFMSQETCEHFYLVSEGNRQRALGQQHPEAAKYVYTACAAVEVIGPVGKPNA